MFAVTGASGRLGRLVLDALLEKVDPGQVVALTRDIGKLAEVARRGVTVRAFDFGTPATLRPALEVVDRLLLISGSEISQRERQHPCGDRRGEGRRGWLSRLHQRPARRHLPDRPCR